jgi:hypothetical protein
MRLESGARSVSIAEIYGKQEQGDAAVRRGQRHQLVRRLRRLRDERAAVAVGGGDKARCAQPGTPYSDLETPIIVPHSSSA